MRLHIKSNSHSTGFLIKQLKIYVSFKGDTTQWPWIGQIWVKLNHTANNSHYHPDLQNKDFLFSQDYSTIKKTRITLSIYY